MGRCVDLSVKLELTVREEVVVGVVVREMKSFSFVCPTLGSNKRS